MEPPFELVVGTVDLTVPRDGLLTLGQAIDLPRLMGQFKPRDLRRYADPKRKRNRLPAVMPGRVYMTTPEWVDSWIEGMRMGAGQASGGTPVDAAPAPTPASTALDARLAKLKASTSDKKRGR